MRIPLRYAAVVVTPFPLLLVLATGCSRDRPEAPRVQSLLSGGRSAEILVSPNGLFFPLQQGNTWHAAGDVSFTDVNTSGVVTGQAIIHQDFVRTITGTEERDGRTYTILREVETDTGDVPGGYEEYTYWYRYRQDGSGLYQADINVTIPPGGTSANGGVATTGLNPPSPSASLLASVPAEQQAAYRAAWGHLESRMAALRGALHSSANPPSGGVLDGELTILSYPLNPGRTWTVRTDPFFKAIVEGVESVVVPAGRFPSFRYRTENTLFTGPRDRVATWVSRSGQVSFSAHFETEVTGTDHTLVFDSNEELQDLVLVGP